MAVGTTNNAAWRLLNILRQAQQKHDNTRTREVWAEVLGVPKDSTVELLRKLGLLLQLCALAKAQLQAAGGTKLDTYTKRFDRIEKAFGANNLDSHWGPFKSHLTEAALDALEIGAHRLSEIMTESEIPQDELDQLRAQVDDLLTSVMDSDLHQPFKEFVTKHLELIRAAILEYRLRGTEGLREALERSIGSLVLHPDVQDDVKTTSLGKKFLSVLSTVGMLVSLTVNTGKLIESGKGLFLSSSAASTGPSIAGNHSHVGKP